MTKPHVDVSAIERKLHPDVLRETLLCASLFLSAWELLKNDVEDGVKGFFRMGFDENGWKYEGYAERVLAKHTNPFEASLLWLVETEALTATQAARFRVLRDHRNQIAHELPSLLFMPEQNVSRELLLEARDLIGILGRFWGGIAADTDPEFDGVDIDYQGIKSGSMLLMEYLLQIAVQPDTEPEQVDPSHEPPR